MYCYGLESEMFIKIGPITIIYFMIKDLIYEIGYRIRKKRYYRIIGKKI